MWTLFSNLNGYYFQIKKLFMENTILEFNKMIKIVAKHRNIIEYCWRKLFYHYIFVPYFTLYLLYLIVMNTGVILAYLYDIFKGWVMNNWDIICDGMPSRHLISYLCWNPLMTWFQPIHSVKNLRPKQPT